MADTYTNIVLAVSIALQLTAAVLALRLARKSGKGWHAWALISAALALMASRRIVTLTGFFLPEDALTIPGPLAETITLVIAALMLGGVLLIPRILGALREKAVAVDASLEKLRASEEELKAQARQKAAVAKLGQSALAGAEPSALMDDAVAAIAETLAVEYCKVLELLPDGQALLLRAGVGWKKGLVGQTTVGTGTDSQAGHTLLSSNPVIVADLRRETRFSGPPLLRDHNVVSGLSVIIQGRERPFGVLGAHTSKRRRFTRDDVNFLQAVANLLAQTIERKRAETVLRRSESSLADAQRIAHLGNWDWDIVHNELRWSDEIHRIFGLAPQEFGATYEAFLASVHPDDREFVKKSVNEAFYEKKPYNIDHRIVLPDGSERLVHERAEVTFDEAGKPTRMVGTVYDITERKRAEDALRKSEERFRRIFYDSQVGMTLTTADTRFVQVNKAFLNMLGYTEEELLGLSVSKIVHSDDWQDHLPVAEQVEKGELDFFEHEKRLLHKRGHEILCLTSVSIIRDNTGKILFSLGQYIDLTERRKLEEQFRQAQKMEAIGRLAGGVAHDFNNLLMVMRGYTELLLNRLKPNDPLRSNAEEIQKAADRATSLTRQLLAFSRKQMLQPRVLDFNTVAADMEKMLRRLIGEDIELVTALDSALGRVKADPGQIEQVVMNLAVNARDAMPQGGKLTLETSNVELTEAFARQHPEVTPGPYVLLAVSDTGCGMDAETQTRVFEPFFTTKEKGKGTGLGLSTVYGIIKQSGGYIWVHSEAGQGTTFEIYLPRVENAVTADQEEQVASQPPSGSETVLLVEDEAPVRKLAREFLQSTGYTVLEAEGPVEALQLSQQHQGPIHLMVTDVVMPKMSGQDLARSLAPQRPEMRVIYISGYTDNFAGRDGVVSENTIFLQKPFSLGELARKVRETLEEAKRPS